MLYAVLKNTGHEVLEFLKNFLRSISPIITQKLKMTLLDVIDIYKIGTVNYL